MLRTPKPPIIEHRPNPPIDKVIGGIGAIVICGTLAACSDNKPKHYYVLCDGKDWNGWDLIYTEKNEGYLTACAYQSPDKRQTRVARCYEHGCD